MELDRFYACVGGNAAQVLDRLYDKQLVRRFLRKFAGDPSYGELKAALAAEDIPVAFRAAHTLKGTAATLGLDTLAAAASELTEALRPADAPLPPQALVTAVDAAYATAIDNIQQL